MRAPLSDIQTQLPGAMRVHRSNLINLERVLSIQGNTRKRTATAHTATGSLHASKRQGQRCGFPAANRDRETAPAREHNAVFAGL